ncbi:MAG: 16S rRNA (guanine(527)-N(7))-methyltransferase RsmG [Desulfobacteraceae bacterium]|jgi:16S rRNA (guanine527-N7)-methyltransferase
MMEIGSDKWIDLVQDGACQLGLKIGRDQILQFAQHARWLMQWNRKINLTAITDPAQVAVKHYLDAIAPIDHIPAQGRLLDIGTGGGFPGIPLKIMRPEQPMTLIDSVRKKVNFVKHVIRQLSLPNIDALHTRAEALCRQNSGRPRYRVVICRALADLNAAVRLAAPLLISKGKIVLYQGPRDSAEPKNCPADVFSLDGITYGRTTITYPLPIFGDARCITILTSD